MSVNISAPVLWDDKGNYRGGALYGIENTAIVVGTVMMPSGPQVPYNQVYPYPQQVDAGQTACLQVKDRRTGTFYLTWTLAEWQAAIGGTEDSPTSLQITIPADGESLTNPYFANPILTIAYQGQVYQLNTDYTQNLTTQTITWTNGNFFNEGQTIVATK